MALLNRERAKAFLEGSKWLVGFLLLDEPEAGVGTRRWGCGLLGKNLRCLAGTREQSYFVIVEFMSPNFALVWSSFNVPMQVIGTDA